MVDKRKVPEIRFKGFSGEWEEKVLGTDVAEIIGGGTPSTSISEYWDGDIDWYSPTEIGKNIYANGSVKKITELGLKNCSGKLLPPDKTILFTSRAGIGDMAILQRSGSTNQGFQSLILKDGYDTYFFYSIGFLITKYAEKHSSGSTFLEISGKKLGQMSVYTPFTVEQSQIGTFFQNLDSLVTLHQRKYVKLTTVKKAMLEKMFPKDGADVPEIRFKGFTEKWERRMLEDVSETIEYGLNASAMEFDGKNKYLRITDIDDVSHKFRTDDLTSPNIDLALSEKYKLKEGDILFARTGASVGKSYIYDKGDELVYFAGFLIRARISPKYNAEFIFQNTLTIAYDNFVKIMSQRSGQPGINAQEYGEYSFMFPEQEEQSQIGIFFNHLDSLISLQQRELDKLKNIKKACLERMFV